MYYIFVYGTLKKGFGNNYLLSGSKFLGERKTIESKWDMINLGWFPAVVYGKNDIIGELYEVDELTLKNVDHLEGNGTFYTRELVSVSNISDPVWMYIMPYKQNYFSECTNDDRVKIITSNKKTYLRWI